MKYLIAIAIGMSTLLAGKTDSNSAQTTARLGEAATVLSEIMETPDKGIPEDLIDKAHCIVVVPSMKKGAFLVGAKYGKGFISCRGADRKGWTAPGAVRIEGGSVGFQIGGSETDLVLLVMNERGAERLLGSKFTLGGEGAVAAGPVGRSASAQTDARMTAEILSWSKARGVFAGVSLQGATLREDRKDNASLYGAELSNKEIVTSARPAPEAAGALMKLLNKYSSQEDRK